MKLQSNVVFGKLLWYTTYQKQGLCLTVPKSLLTRYNLKHGNKFDYSKCVYKGMSKPITIICPIHGSFSQTAYEHTRAGCNQCRKSSTLRRDKFISQAVKVHGNIYKYGKYKGYDGFIKVKCKKHGKFKVNVEAHLKTKKGCPTCSFENKLKCLYGDSIKYHKLKYKGSLLKVKVVCDIHGVFKITPQHALTKKCNLCPQCNPKGFKKHKPAILYYLSINDGLAYKIGVTNRTVEERFKYTDLSKIKVINVVEYVNGGDAYKMEQKILKEFKYAKYTSDPLLLNGNTELFDRDVLLLDTK